MFFRRLRENVIDTQHEGEPTASVEEDNGIVHMTPIDEPFALSDIRDEIQRWLPLEHLPNNASRSLVNDEGGSIDDMTAAALRYFLGDCLSTEAVIDVMRRRDIDSYQTAIEDIVDERRHLFNGNPDRRPSYPEQTRLVYNFVQTAFRLAAEWLREHPPHYDLHLRRLYTLLETSLWTRAADLRDHEIVRLTDLIKAGIFSSPRMEGSLDLRMRMSQDVPGDIQSLRNGESEPRPYMAQWMRAMPLLASAVRQIAESERFTPFHIIDIDCERLWRSEIEAIAPVVLPNETSRAVEPTRDSQPASASNPIVTPLASPTRQQSESESTRATETELRRSQLSQDIMYTENDFPRLPQEEERTARAAESLL